MQSTEERITKQIHKERAKGGNYERI